MNFIEFELAIMDFIAEEKPQTVEDLEYLSDLIHQHVETAVFDYACDDENIDESEYEAQY